MVDGFGLARFDTRHTLAADTAIQAPLRFGEGIGFGQHLFHLLKIGYA
jgi:hypothetical protein